MDGICHQLVRHGLQVHLQHPVDDLLLLLLRHAVDGHAAGQEPAQLLLHGEIPVALPGHKAAHHAGGSQLQLIKILPGILGMHRAEQLHQLIRCHLMDVVGRGCIGIGGDIQLPQGLGFLGDIHLDRRLHGVKHFGLIALAQQPSGNGKLLFIHPLGQLQQQCLLVGKYRKKCR